MDLGKRDSLRKVGRKESRKADFPFELVFRLRFLLSFFPKSLPLHLLNEKAAPLFRERGSNFRFDLIGSLCLEL